MVKNDVVAETKLLAALALQDDEFGREAVEKLDRMVLAFGAYGADWLLDFFKSPVPPHVKRWMRELRRYSTKSSLYAESYREAVRGTYGAFGPGEATREFCYEQEERVRKARRQWGNGKTDRKRLSTEQAGQRDTCA